MFDLRFEQPARFFCLFTNVKHAGDQFTNSGVFKSVRLAGRRTYVKMETLKATRGLFLLVK